MRKRDELTDSNSCLNRARDDEWTFVLLGRDRAAPVAVRAWIAERLRLGKNQPGDVQIVEAEQWARGVLADQANDDLDHGKCPVACPACGGVLETDWVGDPNVINGTRDLKTCRDCGWAVVPPGTPLAVTERLIDFGRKEGLLP